MMQFQWDRDKSKETQIIRQMLWGDLKEVLRLYQREELKKVFLRNYFKFDKKNFSFWKIVLEINDEELNSGTNRSFRRDCKVWHY